MQPPSNHKGPFNPAPCSTAFCKGLPWKLQRPWESAPPPAGPVRSVRAYRLETRAPQKHRQGDADYSCPVPPITYDPAC